MKTKAAVLFKNNHPLAIVEIEIPGTKPGQVLVRIFASGICRSQLNEIQGLRGHDHFLPHLLGHEGSGEVVEIGSGVTKVKPGDFVILSWIKGVGQDIPNAEYRNISQKINSGPIATFCEYAVVSENRVTKISRKIPNDTAALLGCAIATGVGIVRHKLKLMKNSTLVVFGVGGIGASVILGAQLYKPKKIIAVDISEQALAFAKKIGANDQVLFTHSLVDDISSICPEGADFVVEASGNKVAMEQTIAVVKPLGHVIIAGNVGYKETIRINPFEFIKGKTITGTWGGETNPDLDFPLYAQEILDGNLRASQLITRRVKLNDINQVISEMSKHQTIGRTIIDFT